MPFCLPDLSYSVNLYSKRCLFTVGPNGRTPGSPPPFLNNELNIFLNFVFFYNE